LSNLNPIGELLKQNLLDISKIRAYQTNMADQKQNIEKKVSKDFFLPVVLGSVDD